MNKFGSNKGTILSIFAIAGVVITTAVTAIAAPKAKDLLEEKEKDSFKPLTIGEKILTVVPVFLPTIATGSTTIFLILGANSANKSQQAGVMASMALWNKSFKNYKKTLKEVLNDEEYGKVKDRIAEKAYEEFEDDTGTDWQEGKTLYFDETLNRFFYAFEKDVVRAMLKFNQLFASSKGQLGILKFYEILDIDLADEEISLLEPFGYNIYTMEASGCMPFIPWFEQTKNLPDGTIYRSMSFAVDPEPNYWEETFE